MSEFEITPKANTKVNFKAAVAFVRKCITYNRKPIMLSGGHRGVRANLDAGYIVIEQAWFPDKQ